MTTDVRTLLHDTADVPNRGPDIDGAMRSARDRRRRRRGVGALAAVVVLTLLGGVFVATTGGGGDDARVAIGPGQSTDVPEGWTQVHADPGITMAIPPGWGSYDFGRTPVADIKIAVGTVDPGEQIPLGCPESPSAGESGPSGSWVSVWEYPAGSASVASPTGGTIEVGDREVLANAGVGGTCDGGAFAEVAFRDAGRVFVARVVTRVVPDDISDEERAHVADLESQVSGLTAQLASKPPNEDQLSAQVRVLLQEIWATYGLTDDLDLAKRVLETLHVEPLTPATTTPSTVEAPTTTLPRPTITTLPAFVPSTDDERAIQQLVERWLGGEHNEESQRATIEDADSILDAIRQGLAQYPDRLPYYTGSLDALRFNGPDRASIRFTLYYKGQPAYVRDGDVVRVDGTWKVTRATECAFLAQGGITCPPPL